MSRSLWISGEKGVWSQPASGRSGRARWGGWGTEQRQEKVWVTEDSRQNTLWQHGEKYCQRELVCMCLGGKPGPSLKARDSPCPAAGTEESWWVAGLTRAGWVMQLSSHAITKSALAGQSATLEHVRPFPVSLHFHCSLPSPGCLPESASITQRFLSLPGCSALAELNSL